ncbi:MAG: NUDIX hydrolase [Pirellulales bacterium]
MSHSSEELLTTRKFRVVRHHTVDRDGRPLSKEIVEHPGAVTIVPLLDDGRVCLIRNQRLAAGKTLVELPAGTLEPNEDPAETARRELTEETGYRAQSIDKLCEFYMSPGILTERMYLYVARGLEAGSLALEPGETIEPLLVTWDEALRMATSGEIEDAKTLVGLLYYDRVRARA